MDIVSRLKQFMEYTKMANSQFADTALIPRPTLSQIMSGRNKKISNEIIGKIHEAFPQLNVIWLLFGDGQMLVSGNTPISEPQNGSTLFDSIDYVPYGKSVSGTNTSSTDNPYLEAEKSKAPKPYPRFNPAHTNGEYDAPAERPTSSPYEPRQTSQGDERPAPQSEHRQAVQPRQQSGRQSTVSLELDPNIAPFVAAAETAGNAKHIASIMVFYTDNSFETFYPRNPEK